MFRPKVRLDPSAIARHLGARQGDPSRLTIVKGIGRRVEGSCGQPIMASDKDSDRRERKARLAEALRANLRLSLIHI